MKYVALLRGINIGGRNKIDMKKLAKTFVKLRLDNVVTYINSGNVIFETNQKESSLAGIIEMGISNDFHLEIPVVVRTAENIISVSKKVPKSWLNNKEDKTDVMFLWPEVDNDSSITEIESNPKVDQLMRLDGCVVWHVSKGDYSQTDLNKLIGTKLYKKMTVRNINTVRKLASLMTEPE